MRGRAQGIRTGPPNQRDSAGFKQTEPAFPPRPQSCPTGSFSLREPGERFVVVAAGVAAFAEGMGAIGIDHEGELFVLGDEFIHQSLAVLVMGVVVAGAIDEEEISFELVSVDDRRAVRVAFREEKKTAHRSATEYSRIRSKLVRAANFHIHHHFLHSSKFTSPMFESWKY